MSFLNALRRDRRRAVSPETATVRPFDHISLGLVTFASRRRPVYCPSDVNEASTDAVFTRAVAAADDAPAASDLGFDTLGHGAVSLFWSNADGSDRVAVTFTPWVLTGLGWVKATDGEQAAVGEKQEVRLEGVAYRRLFIQVTNLGAGDGAIDLYLGGEA